MTVAKFIFEAILLFSYFIILVEFSILLLMRDMVLRKVRRGGELEVVFHGNMILDYN